MLENLTPDFIRTVVVVCGFVFAAGAWMLPR